MNYTTAAKLTTVSNMFHNCCFGGVWPIGADVVDAPAALKDPENGDYSLRSDSPCIDAGTDAFGLSGTDLVGFTRVSGARVDLGAYEYDLSRMTGDFAKDVENPRAGDTITITATVRGGAAATHALQYDWHFTEARGGSRDFSVIDGPNPLVREFPSAGRYTVRLVVKDLDDAGAEPLDVTRTDFLKIAARTNYVVSADTPGAGDGEWPYDTEESATTNIQAVIDCALGGETILLQEGVHYLSKQLLINRPVTVHGAGGYGKTTLRQTGSGFCAVSLNPPQAVLEGVRLGDVARSVGSFRGLVVTIDSEGGTLRDCRVTGVTQTTGIWGGGTVAVKSKKGLVTHCVIDNNNIGLKDENAGGGVWLSDGTLSDSFIYGNRAMEGGGVAIRPANTQSKVRVVNCTVIGNYAEGEDTFGGSPGGGISIGHKNEGLYDADVKVVNCIFAGNTVKESRQGEKGAPEWGYPVATCKTEAHYTRFTNMFANCCFDGVWPIGADVVDAPAALKDPENGDYSLRSDSPCIDAGTDAFGLSGTDLVGFTRVSGARVDLGAYEYDLSRMTGDFAKDVENPRAGDTITITATVRGGAAATHALQYDWHFTEARGGSRDFSVIDGPNPLVREFPSAGRYTVRLVVKDLDDAGAEPLDVTRTDFLKIAARTNYVVSADTPGAGDGEWPYDTEESATTNIQAVIDCALGGETIVLLPGNHYVTKPLNVTNAVTLVGRDGRDATFVRAADGEKKTRLLCVNNRSAVVRGLTFTGILKGTANGIGAAGSTSPGYVGGIYGDGGTVEDCAIAGNTGTGGSWPQGCFAVYSERAQMRRCVVRGNATSANMNSEFSGGGVLMVKGLLEDSLIVSNKAPGGAGIGLRDGTVRNCTVVGNTASGSYGGGVEFGNPNGGFGIGSPRLENCIVCGNIETTTAKGNPEWGTRATTAKQYTAITNAVSHCCFGGVWPIGDTMIDGDPMFKSAAKGDYHLRRRSPCLNTGLGAEWMDAATDLDGRPRMKHVTPAGKRLVDVGCYESVWRPGGLLLFVR